MSPSIWTAPTAIQHICQSSGYNGQCLGDQWIDNVDLHPSDVFTDINQCHLQGVSWVIPSAENSATRVMTRRVGQPGWPQSSMQ